MPTIQELRAQAKEKGITIPFGSTKQAIIDLLNGGSSTAGETPNHVHDHSNGWESEQRKIDRLKEDPILKG